MKVLRGLLWSIGFLGAVAPMAWAQSKAVERPKITGISHVGYFVSDLPKSLAFWHGFLGFDEMYDLKKPGTKDVHIAFLKINDQQHIELFNEPPTNPPDMMSHICFAVSDVEQMKAYLRSQGFEVKSPAQSKVQAGDYAFAIKDPDGMLVEFVQSLPDGWEAKAAGKFEPETRISTKIFHAGFMVGNAAKSMDFYGRVLGFTETWRGSADGKDLSWINMKVPDGEDYVELMLYRTLEPKGYGGKNHLSLAVPDMDAAVAKLKARPAFAAYGKPLEIHTGINRKRQVNLFDPDGTRVELMEPFTVDGKPAVPSTALPPPPSHD